MQRTVEVKKLSNLIRRKLITVGEGKQISHYQILAFIESRECTYQRDIDKAFSFQRPTTTELLRLMEKKGLVTKEGSKKDLRLKQIIITQKGREVVKNSKPHLLAIEKGFVEGVSKDDLKTFDKVIKIMINNGEKRWSK